MNNDDGRLTRIETKLDKLTDVVVQLATHNERIITLEEKTRTQSKRIDSIQATANQNSRVTWIASAGIIAAVSYVVRSILTGG